MANTQAMCTSFMGELLNGQHQFGSPTLVSRGSLTAPTADTFKALLVLASATVNAAQSNVGTPGSGAQSNTNIGTAEVTGTNYTSGGVTITSWATPTATNTGATTGTAFTTPSASFVYGSVGSPVTLSTAFDTVVIYNSTQGGRTVSVHTFGSQTISAGVFTLTMPSNSTTTALLRLAT